ncbi:LAMI_0B03818g1_1 [Lachancea mirantina]|uniref:LAMI_0B03818g1_1 n=1 Tax=Lachancea mirantina TaxID=1230905 RepID=A0A1G4IV21_9SACH|nr:LAMI_0B03818g1_1 [Lachancea mirantina]
MLENNPRGSNTGVVVALLVLFCLNYLLTVFGAPFENVTNRSAFFFYWSLEELLAVFFCCSICILLHQQPLRQDLYLLQSMMVGLSFLNVSCSIIGLVYIVKCLKSESPMMYHFGQNQNPVVLTRRILVVTVLSFASWSTCAALSCCVHWKLVQQANMTFGSNPRSSRCSQSNDWSTFYQVLHGMPKNYEAASSTENVKLKDSEIFTLSR